MSSLVRPDGTDDHVLVDGLVSDNPNGEYQHPGLVDPTASRSPSRPREPMR